jgi:molecular chaperone DnaK
MGSPVLGIDLGTTNSVAAVALDGRVRVLADAEGNKLFPSVVSFHPNGDVLAGYPARERRLVDAANTIYSVKRLIGRPFASPEVERAVARLPFGFRAGPTGGPLVVARGETYTLPEISAFVLRGVRALAEDALKQPCRRAVITVPANFNELQRSATKAAGRVAGLDVLRILNEPTAAALAYGCGSAQTRERVAVYDLGGGTFDITILELAGDVFEVLSTAGDTFLGGDDIDVIVADEMAQAFLAQTRYDARRDPQAYERLRAAAEWAKCQLSSSEEVELTVEELAYGDGGRALDLRYAISRGRLEALVHDLVARTFVVCEEALRLAGMRPSQLDQVILVGGSTRMPLVRKLVEQFFARPPLANLDPDLVVAQGAAIQGAALAGQPEEEAPSTGATAIGRLALKKQTLPGMAGPLNIREENVPAGPAFQPKRPVAPGRVEARGTAREQGMDSRAELASEQPPALSLPSLPSAEGGRGAELELEEGDAQLPELDLPQPPAAAPAPAVDELRLPAGAAPLLLDVTPQTLRIETVQGYTEVIIERNAAIPVEQSRLFSTSQDFQESVRVRVCQGESRKLDENQELGVVELTGLRPLPRGQSQIEVTFLMDADGTLQVRAKDQQTGRLETIRINLVGGVDEREVERMRGRQRELVT